MSIRSYTLRAAAAALSGGLALTMLAGCGDAEADAAAGTSSSSQSPSPSPSPEPTAAPTAPADPDAAQAQITENWQAFFANGDPALLEDGDQLTEAVVALGAMAPPGQEKTASVTEVTFTSDTEATVIYDLLIGGAPVLPGASGAAVLADDTWKVSKTTFCTLVSLSAPQGTAIPGCS